MNYIIVVRSTQDSNEPILGTFGPFPSRQDAGAFIRSKEDRHGTEDMVFSVEQLHDFVDFDEILILDSEEEG